MLRPARPDGPREYRDCGGDDARHVRAVTAAEVAVVVRTLLDGNDQGTVTRLARVGRHVAVLRPEQLDVVHDVIREVGMRRVTSGVDDRDGDALAGVAGGTGLRAAHCVGRCGVEELDALVWVDIRGDPVRHRELHRRDRSLHDGQRQLLHRLDLETERAQLRHLRRARHRLERGDADRNTNGLQREQPSQPDMVDARPRGAGGERERGGGRKDDPAQARDETTNSHGLLSSLPAWQILHKRRPGMVFPPPSGVV